MNTKDKTITFTYSELVGLRMLIENNLLKVMKLERINMWKQILEKINHE